MAEIYSFIPFVATVVNLLVTAIIYFKNVNNPVNRSFAYWSLALVFWNLGGFMAFSAIDEKTAWIGYYVNAVGLCFIPSTFFNFVLEITKNKNKKNILLCKVSFILSFIFLSLALFTKTFFSKIIHYSWGWSSKIGMAGYIYMPFLLLLAYYGLYLIWKTRNSSVGVERNQLLYIFFGSIVGYIGGTISIITITTGNILYPMAYLFNIFFIAIIAYAILVYRIMDVAIVLRKGLSYVILSAVILSVYVTGGYLYQQAFGSLVSLPITILMMIGASCFTLFIILTLREGIEKGLGKLIFAGRYNYQEMLQSLGKSFATSIDIKDLSYTVVNRLAETVDVEKSCLILLDRSEGEYSARSGFGIPDEIIEKIKFKKDSEVVKFMASGSAFFKDEIMNNRRFGAIAEDESLKRMLEDIGAYLCLSVMGKEGLIGILTLDKKKSGHIYTHEDLVILDSLCSQIAISVESAKLFQGQKEIMRQLIQSEKMITVGQLTAGIVHDIRNPLSVISGRSQLLLREKLQEEVHSDLKIIYDQTKRIADIIDSLLRLSKSSDLKFEEIDINDIVGESLKFVEKQKLMRGIAVMAQFSHSIPMIRGDRVQMSQVFINLINNAKDAMPNGGELSINTRFSDANVEVEFTDTGEGIEPENMKKMFLPFFTTKEKGSGLGLFIVNTIVIAHGGKIEARSEQGKGTTFIIRLPVFAELGLTERTETGMKIKKEVITIRRKINVLVVDDDKDIANTVSRYCTDIGLHANISLKGKDAVKKVSKETVDVVILDINLPDLNGLEVLKNIKEIKPEIKVIMLSGIDDHSTALQSLKYGAMDYVKKPLDFDSLEKSILAAISLLS